jgi:DNA-directed RNA polymerase subunit alpha
MATSAMRFTTDVRMLLDRDPFDQSAVADLLEALSRDPSRYSTLREAVAAMQTKHAQSMSPDIHLRLGVAQVLLGRYSLGIGHLEKAGEVGLAHYYRGLALECQQRFREAAQAFGAAAELGYLADKSQLHRAGALRRLGESDQARELLDKLKDRAQSIAEYHHQRGCLLVEEGLMAEAAEAFETALKLDKDHSGALFQLAYLNDLAGNDETARELYQRCVQKPPVPLGALINLGILYEDEEKYREAEQCFRRVLDIYPNHPRARLYLKDVRASKEMYYDEEAERRYDHLRQVLEIPVTDFELSVRSRNCLKKMGIRTLGDLTRITESQLLSSKNFGETSLTEIKAMMEAKSLRLGMAIENGEAGGFKVAVEPVDEPISPEERAKLAMPITELNLSVRARKCMNKLGITTVGELIAHTQDQLLECKNFGVTSLNEVRDKLSELGLKLKND